MVSGALGSEGLGLFRVFGGPLGFSVCFRAFGVWGALGVSSGFVWLGVLGFKVVLGFGLQGP